MSYKPAEGLIFPGFNLGLTIWQGTFENEDVAWLHWTDGAGNLLLTGVEREQIANERAKGEAERAFIAEGLLGLREVKLAERTEQLELEKKSVAEKDEQIQKLTETLQKIGIDPKKE